ncbi:5221_t:CDS:2, partial [Funneliformis geosporum]
MVEAKVGHSMNHRDKFGIRSRKGNRSIETYQLSQRDIAPRCIKPIGDILNELPEPEYNAFMKSLVEFHKSHGNNCKNIADCYGIIIAIIVSHNNSSLFGPFNNSGSFNASDDDNSFGSYGDSGLFSPYGNSNSFSASDN